LNSMNLAQRTLWSWILASKFVRQKTNELMQKTKSLDLFGVLGIILLLQRCSLHQNSELCDWTWLQLAMHLFKSTALTPRLSLRPSLPCVIFFGCNCLLLGPSYTTFKPLPGHNLRSSTRGGNNETQPTQPTQPPHFRCTVWAWQIWSA
jgi:hypothetical protein